jgi:hypothetical protein
LNVSLLGNFPHSMVKGHNFLLLSGEPSTYNSRIHLLLVVTSLFSSFIRGRSFCHMFLIILLLLKSTNFYPVLQNTQPLDLQLNDIPRLEPGTLTFGQVEQAACAHRPRADHFPGQKLDFV